ncbi:putative oxalate decarboxylase/oxidase [Boletus reticuloceps]|uniref:Putative oxalate decarboxylase/oxidase n=1 Tax=Boletus reticuloceps TaxID=495285 RepID=A0A8I3A6J4_9AGAM|nr:putative oxalate decarboxylase/oxidase [Boletus reticuloceps]
MTKGFSAALTTLLFAAIASCSPVNDGNGTASTGSSFTASSTSAAASASPTVPYASDDPNAVLWTQDSNILPEPERGGLGGSILGPQNVPIELQNPDLLAPPTTDYGDIPNAKWPMALSHQRLQTGGWARQENKMAGVNMRLEVGAIRELHWHKTAEWSYVISGYVQVTSVDQNGKNFIGTVGPGDLWYFPAGIPHSLQATNQSADGVEFLLIFDDGTFSEDATFLVNWLAHVPKEVIAKNFQTSISAFNNIPSRELYIFPALPPSTTQAPSDPQGTTPQSFTFPLSQVPITPLSGGSVKVADSTTFPVSITIAAAEVSRGTWRDEGVARAYFLKAFALCIIYSYSFDQWHPTQDEWDFYLEGTGRMTLFASQSNARTWDFQAGDVAYVPASYGHYVENIGNTTLKFLEIFRTDIYQDVSLAQWLALTPPAIVQAHLGLSDETIAMLNKTKQVVVGPAPTS